MVTISSLPIIFLFLKCDFWSLNSTSFFIFNCPKYIVLRSGLGLFFPIFANVWQFSTIFDYFLFFFLFQVSQFKVGQIILAKDVCMIIFRKSNSDTASDWRKAFVQSPNNPKFSPSCRKSKNSHQEIE